MTNKVISIIDCFIASKLIEENLSNVVDNLNANGHTVLIVSNTPIPEYIIKKVKYVIYDSKNRLFEEEYEDVHDVIFWKGNENIFINNVMTGVQRHGLAVLINLFNALHFAKQLGYTHFYRFEADVFFGDKSMNYINNIPNLCNKNDKQGLFYFNETSETNSISFIFYSEIDFFLNNVKEISSEKDYVDFLISRYGRKHFLSAESYVYQNLIHGEIKNIIKKNGQTDLTIDYPDSIWNTVTSDSNIDKKYDGCSSRLYHVYDENNVVKNSMVLLTYNYTERQQERKIKGYFTNTVEQYNHQVQGKESFMYNIIPDDVIKIEVYNGDNLMYTEKNENIKCNVILRKK